MQQFTQVVSEGVNISCSESTKLLGSEAAKVCFDNLYLGQALINY
ncbi:hypothetical protein FDUTEX481_06796 [Tolypothrix sp. PCC 7601]|nr:hypothetical protein FDUTEX481_06796 [Tolypothrix sp. PCC 7601]